MNIVRADNNLAELERQPAGYASKARREPEPEATRSREQAKRCREWIAALKSGMWIP